MLNKAHLYVDLALLLGLAGACGPQAVAAVPAEVVDMASVADQSHAPPPCRAAAGLAGDVLLCADFSQIPSLDDPTLGNWAFQVVPQSDCWQISNGTLANKDVPNIDSLCAATLPAIDLTAPAFARYSRLTLSMQYDSELGPQQSFRIYLTNSGNISAGPIFIQQGADVPVRSLSVPVDKRDLPATLNHLYKPQLQLMTGGRGSTTRGLMIHALAVIGSD